MKIRHILAAGASLLLAAQPALAASFSEDRAAVWVQRSNALIDAVTADDLTFETLSPRLSDACKGVTMEVAKPDIPTWAQQGQLYFCHAADDIKHRYGKAICKDLKTSIKALEKADPAKDPETAVDAAKRLRIVAGVMLEGFQKSRVC